MDSEIDPSSITVRVGPCPIDRSINPSTFAYHDSELAVLCDGVIHIDRTASLRLTDLDRQLEIGQHTIDLGYSCSVYDSQLAQEALALALAPFIETLRRRPAKDQPQLPLA